MRYRDLVVTEAEGKHSLKPIKPIKPISTPTGKEMDRQKKAAARKAKARATIGIEADAPTPELVNALRDVLDDK